jgi:hypothetical protein|tara:strand:+ start:787 stop:942 length:156 start_codon:yes stop_codon:yes gene_type:complete
MVGIDKKHLYPLFIGVYTVVALATLWNIREMHKVRQLQSKALKNKMDALDA